MTDPTSDVTSRADPEHLSVSLARHRRRGLILLAAAVFQLWVWGTRIANLLGDASDFSSAFVAVHLVLYITSIAVAVVLGVMGIRMWRESRERHGRPRPGDEVGA